jgi:hypothetical protein
MNGLQDVTKLAERLTAADQLALVEYLAHRLRSGVAAERKPVDLYGAWKGKFPEDTDIIADIREIRDGWRDEFEAE